eukprot:XP_011616536.1 PREDICTED: multiple epidermal growth factor-like domains protein 10 [Takifugu rubripes]
MYTSKSSPGVLLLFNFLISLGDCLDPGDSNVCSLWESFTTSVKESYLHPYDQVTEEACSDPRTADRCLHHRIIYKTAYRQAVKTEYRKRYQCCPGFYESRNKCVPRCTMECVHGRCIAPDQCQCERGWRGDDCSSGRNLGAVCTEQCPEGRFGPNCTEECVCHNRGECDTKTGQCQCAKGFTGDRCNEECAAGTYGQDCKGVCDCANGARCYNIDGGCLCEPGFHGPQCRERMCALGKYGMHCENTCLCQDKHTLSCHPMKGECTCQPGWAGLFCNETCPHGFYGHGCLEPCLCVNGGVCDGSTGQCQCASGFTGVHCENQCKSGTFGRNCSLECSCDNYINCSPVDGTCFCKEGWQGADCSSQCSEGTWGPGCNSTCLCTNGAKCNPADGSCTCTAGWHGTYCDQMCPMGTFGPGCLKKCDCVHADGCQAATGKCHCLPGWWGSTCSEPCSAGLWGRHCNQTCFKHCPNSDTCLRETGACICRPGFLGETCQNKCRPGTYGEQCSMPCPSCGQSYRCHHVTGKCDCLPGYTGANCDQDCPPGYYGKMCSEVCDICANNSTCNPHDGHCECLPGWTARDCSKPCSAGHFGPFCTQTCSCPANHICDQFTGDCVCENGDDCQQESSEQSGSVMVPLPPSEKESWGAITGTVALVILVVLLLALLLLYRHRQRDKENNTPTVSFSTSRTVNSEYAIPDVPHSYHHYYSNPSYHTLSQNRPPLPHIPNNHEHTIKTTNNQLFCSVKNMERERRGLFGVEMNATLPADWKHHESRKSAVQELKDTAAISSSSLNSENPYATIKDLPGLPFCPPESSYMEMKSAVPRDRAYTEIGPPPCNTSSLYTGSQTSAVHASHEDPPNHYDLPVNSHIPGHYDLPPIRRPPYPRRTTH